MDEDQKITLYDADLYEKVEPKENSIQFIVFRVSQEWYGVEITRVREVVEVGKITYLPSSPDYIAGIVSLRGAILSVTDLNNFFGLPPQGQGKKQKIVVVSSGILETGFLCDEVAKPMEVPVTKIDPMLATIAPEKAEFFEGAFKADNKLIGILRVDKILERK